MLKGTDEDDRTSRECGKTAAESPLLLLVNLEAYDARVHRAISKLAPQAVFEAERGAFDALLATGLHQKAPGYLLRGRGAALVIETINAQQPSTRHTGCEGDGSAPPPRPSTDALAALSTRERQILQLVVRGNSSAQIGSLLSLSPKRSTRTVAG